MTHYLLLVNYANYVAHVISSIGVFGRMVDFDARSTCCAVCLLSPWSCAAGAGRGWGRGGRAFAATVPFCFRRAPLGRDLGRQ